MKYECVTVELLMWLWEDGGYSYDCDGDAQRCCVNPRS